MARACLKATSDLEFQLQGALITEAKLGASQGITQRLGTQGPGCGVFIKDLHFPSPSFSFSFSFLFLVSSLPSLLCFLLRFCVHVCMCACVYVFETSTDSPSTPSQHQFSGSSRTLNNNFSPSHRYERMHN